MRTIVINIDIDTSTAKTEQQADLIAQRRGEEIARKLTDDEPLVDVANFIGFLKETREV